MQLKTLTKKLSNLAYTILFLHRFMPARRKVITFKESPFIIIVIAFNNPDILREQYVHLTKFVKDRFDYIVADNSSDEAKSAEIQTFCKEHALSYVKIPSNPLTGIRASGSHGVALNWCYRNLVQKYRPKYFGFIDHDIFPLKDISIIPCIDLGLYGAVRTRKDPYWYMWPGFCFFEYEKVVHTPLNFFPHHAGKDGSIFLDTGGANYYALYKHIGRNGIREAKSIFINKATRNEFIKGEDSSQVFEIIDGAWLHLRQIAWRAESQNKMNEMEEILSLALERIG